METIRIRKAGYPIRHTFAQFLKRYRLLDGAHQSRGDEVDMACALAAKILGDSSAAGGWQKGLTKIFLKDSHDQTLEEQREEVFTSKAIVLQRFIRGAVARKRFAMMKTAMVVFQNHWRAFLVRQRHEVLAQGIERLQAVVSMKQLTPQFQRTRRTILCLQAYIRGVNARKAFQKLNANVEKIQSIFRMLLACAKVRTKHQEMVLEREKEENIRHGIAAAEAERIQAEKQAQMAKEEARKKKKPNNERDR